MHLLANLVGVTLLLLPALAHPCMLVAPGRAPTIEGIRVSARRQTFLVGGQDVAGWDAQLVIAYDVVPEGQFIGIVFPVDADAGVELDRQEGPSVVSALTWIDEVTEPEIHDTRDTSCQGCDVLDPVLPPPVADDISWNIDWDASGYELATATTVAELESWLNARSFVLTTRTSEALLLALAQGQKIVMATASPGTGPGALYPLRIRSPGPLNLPFSLASECGDRSMELTLFAVAPVPANLDGWDTVYLDEIDRDLFRTLPGLPGVYERLTSDHRGELFVIEAVMDLEGDTLFDLAFDPTIESLLGTTGLLTRMRALVSGADLENDAELILDPGGHELENQLDLRPDPEAHGASLPTGHLFLLVALLLHLGRRPRR